MRYDTLIIGAGLAGLAAGIRLSMYERKVAILERHSLLGGLNSFYRLRGRRHDVGLHALTNATAARTGALSRVLRQLRVSRDELALGAQRRSLIRFPDLSLSFSNEPELFESELAAAFPARRDALAALHGELAAFAPDGRAAAFASARAELLRRLGDERLVDALLLPICYYGSPLENDIDWTQFRILFQSLFREGIARPRGGIRTLLAALKTRLESCGAELRTNCGVARIRLDGARAVGVELDDGSELACDHLLSSAGLDETLALCGRGGADARAGAAPGRDLSFLESIHVLDRTPAALGLDAAVAFYCTADRLCYAQSDEPTEPRCGVLSCPGNYADQEAEVATLVRQTVIANPLRWRELAASGDDAYRAAKLAHSARAAAAAAQLFPDWSPHTRDLDVFTPRTIEHYTGHVNGRVYGSPDKRLDGDVGIGDLHLIGTDQGYLGIVGAMMSGIAIANRHVLQAAGGTA
ncbi:MAG: NAD(P)/FAD-dependent oxidoreductase [Planctomycetota bacterium]|nr:MAG: NAD(P)/FAD-dependent oxidoreductase [Planctomycetota bacterium]